MTFREELLAELATSANHEDAERILNEFPEGFEKGPDEMLPDIVGLSAIMLAWWRLERKRFPGESRDARIVREGKACSDCLCLGITYQKYILAWRNDA